MNATFHAEPDSAPRRLAGLLRSHRGEAASWLVLALLVSTQVLFQPHLFEFWDLPELALAWLRHFAEVAAIGAGVGLSMVGVARARVRHPLLRGLAYLAAPAATSTLLTALVMWGYSGAWLPSAPTLLLGEALRYCLLGLFMLAMWHLKARAVRAAAAARTAEADQRALEREVDAAQLQLLQAQIEPHFLFNTLATVRRLYRREPLAGAQAIDNLMVYLHAALPTARRHESTLGEEFALARAYLDLIGMRMGPRLRYTLSLPPHLNATPFAPMVLQTLIENAIKHGLAPADLGGRITVSAEAHDDRLVLTVRDDGVGFGASAGGSGVGLVNIRRQLAGRYGERSHLTLEEAEGGGVQARITIDGLLDAGAAVSAAVSRRAEAAAR